MHMTIAKQGAAGIYSVVSSFGFPVPGRAPKPKTRNMQPSNSFRTAACRHRKGQYFSFDAIVASIIFIITFITLVSYWFSVKSSLESKEEELAKEAARISDSLLSPAFLLESYETKKINKTRLLDLESKSQPDLKKMFNSPYNISIIAEERDGTRLMETEPDPTNASYSELFNKTANIVKVRRIFVMDDGADEVLGTIDVYLYN